MTEIPQPATVLDLIQAFRRSKVMFVAVSLGIFDRLADAPADAAALAEALGANSDALARLLDACVGLGLLEKHDATYANSPVADAYLTRSSPHTLPGYPLLGPGALPAVGEPGSRHSRGHQPLATDLWG